MNSNAGLKKILFILLIASAFGCEKEERQITMQDSADITEEALVDAYYQELDDLAGVVMNTPTDDQFSGGRTSATITVQDSRFNCAGIVVTIEPHGESSARHPRGIITVNFGTGCTDQQGNVRSGKVIFAYDGLRFASGSRLTTTVDNYAVNGVKLEGSRVSINTSGSSAEAPRFNVTLQDGKATFQDGTVALRESDITCSWIRQPNPSNDKLIIEINSTAWGATRGGRSYEVSLTRQLEFKRFCRMAISGIKKYRIDSDKVITVDYGDGDCDRVITVSVGNISRKISVG